MEPYTIDEFIREIKKLNSKFGNDPIVIVTRNLGKEFMNPARCILMVSEINNVLRDFNVDKDSLLVTCGSYDREETIIHTAEMLCELEKYSKEGYGDRQVIIYGGGVQFHRLQKIIRIKYKPDWPYAVYLTDSCINQEEDLT